MDEANPGNPGTYRAALAAVIILSVLLAAAVIGVVAGFVHQAGLLHQAKPPANAASAAPAAATVTLVPGAHIVSAATESGKLVLQVQTPAGSEVDVMDLTSGNLTRRVVDGAK